MAIILDLPEYRTIAGLSTEDSARDGALRAILREVNDAITQAVKTPITSTTYTEYYDAPADPMLVLRWWPVTSITSVHVAPGSNGNPTSFTSDTEWDEYTHWVLEKDQPDGSSRSARLRSVRGFWGWRYRVPFRRLAAEIDPDYRAVKVVYVAGWTAIPQSLKAAAVQMTGQLFLRRRSGVMPASASLNGGSYSFQTPGTAVGMLGDPTIAELIAPFTDISV